MSATSYLLFIGVRPRLEFALDAELDEWGASKKRTRARGGVELRVSRDELWRLAHGLRLAESLRVRIGSAPAHNFDELLGALKKVNLSPWLDRRQVPRVHVAAHRSSLFHTGAIEERLQQALVGRAASDSPEEGPPTAPTRDAADLHVRIVRNVAQFSIEAGGRELFKRGFRKGTVRAPARETLAAAVVRLGLKERPEAVWDPFMGGGTMLLETALRYHFPALPRRFAFERWPTHDDVAYRELLAAGVRSEASAADVPLPLYGCDVAESALRAAAQNLTANAAAIGATFTADRCDFLEFCERVPRGAAVVTNLPWGGRLREGGRGLYRRFGAMVGEAGRFGEVVVLNSSPSFAEATGLRWDICSDLRVGSKRVQILAHRPS